MTDWLYPRDLAEALGVSIPTACRVIRTIPGAELLYSYEKRKGSRWRVSREDYARWRESQQVAG